MKEYLISVISVAALGRIVVGICPEGEGKKLKSAVSLILSLFFIISVARPLVMFVEKVDKNAEGIIVFSDVEADEYTQVWHKTLEKVGEQSIGEFANELLWENFGLDGESYDLRFVFEDGEPKSLEIVLLGKGLFMNPRKIELLLCEAFGCDVSVR